jgi:uncharacterized protein (TIGR00645 family)
LFEDNHKHLVKSIENVIFNIRWVLPFFYFGLIVVFALYGVSYVIEIGHLIYDFCTDHPSLDIMELIMLNMIDVVMVANLVKMIIAGSYNSFISKKHGYENERISSGGLKIKIASSIIVVAAIHLLKEFVTQINWDELKHQIAIMLVLLLTSVVLSLLEYLHIVGEKVEAETEEREHKYHTNAKMATETEHY